MKTTSIRETVKLTTSDKPLREAKGKELRETVKLRKPKAKAQR